MSVNPKVKRRQKIEQIHNVIRYIVLGLVLLILLNNLFFKLDFFDSYKAAAALGNEIKPTVTLGDGEAAVYFINIGQGDCSLIMTSTHNVLIDGGDLDGGDIIVGALKSLGVKRLDYVMITHPHVDHFGGMTEIFGSFSVGVLLLPDVPDDMLPRTFNYSRLLAAIERSGVKSEFVSTGDRYPLGDGSRLEIVAPLYNDYDELNNLSIAARFVHGGNSFLFTGDFETAAERDLLNVGIDLHADVLKVGHHGSAGSSSKEFLEAVSPRIAVFEAGVYNTFGHPRAAVLERLNAVGCEKAYATSLNGNIAIISDGSDLRVKVEKARAVLLDGYG